MQWLADTLLQAEKDEEFVHILGHVPPGHEHCQSTWKREYIKIVNRFANIIRAQFNGHTHNDELQLFYSTDDKINNVAWNGGSVTAYENLNPNYKLYIVDSKNYVSTCDHIVPIKYVMYIFIYEPNFITGSKRF